MIKDEMKITFTQTITREEMKNRISMALKDPILQQGFEIICKTLEGCLLAEQEHTQMLEQQIEKMKCCANCKSFKGYGETCEGWGEPALNLNCDCTEWELRK